MAFTPEYEVHEERRPYTFHSDKGAAGGRIGCLMLHGFMGSPGSSRPMAEYLSAQGITMHCPLLPGHGSYPDKLYKVPYRAWLDEAEKGFDTLRQLCDELFIIGHSMGTVLGAYLASKHDEIRGMVMLTPLYDLPDKRLRFMRLLRYLVPWFYPHRFKSLQELVRQRMLDFDPTLDLDDPAVQARIPSMTRVPTSGLDEMVKAVRLGRSFWSKLTLPVLIFQGGEDPAVPPSSFRKIYDLLPSQEKQLKTFPDAGHELMRPFEPVHATVWQMIHQFFLQHTKVSLGTAVS